MIKYRTAAVCAALLLVSGCKQEERKSPIKTDGPKTSYGQAIAGAKNAAKLTEEAQKRELEAALGDEDTEESR